MNAGQAMYCPSDLEALEVMSNFNHFHTKMIYSQFTIKFCNKNQRSDCLFDENDEDILKYLENEYFTSLIITYNHLIE